MLKRYVKFLVLLVLLILASLGRAGALLRRAEHGRGQAMKRAQAMKTLARLLAAGAIIALLSSLGWSQASTDRSEMDQWLKDTANQGEVPLGTKITPGNWQQNKGVLPLGMQAIRRRSGPT
jgi:hypothetical protein